MIFVTVGSHEPFDRLVAEMDRIAADPPPGAPRVYGQITGRAGYRPANFDWVDELDAAAYRDACEAATCFVAHAGMGSIITAMERGKPIVILPRRGHLGETRNDHQYDTAMKLEGKPGVFVAPDTADLAAAVADALAWEAGTGSGKASLSAFAEDRLIAFLRGAINGKV